MFEYLSNHPFLLIILFFVLRIIFSKNKNNEKIQKNENQNLKLDVNDFKKSDLTDIKSKSISLQELLNQSYAKLDINTKSENKLTKIKAPSNYDFKSVSTKDLKFESVMDYDTQAIDYDVSANDYDVTGIDFDTNNQNSFKFKNPIDEPDSIAYHESDYGFHQTSGFSDSDKKNFADEMKDYNNKTEIANDLNWIYTNEGIYRAIIMNEILGKPKFIS
ncbi:MAG: hypothetical protein IPP08_09610 [Chlorobiota bacterium]|nr:MAG: hypothetical protein IPP08_09610 [Chlorobiota bacterium]